MKMRIRRLATLFWSLCTVVCFVLIYYLTENILKVPSRSSTVDEMKDNKWIHFENKLKHLESEVNEYHAVVGELKSAFQQLVPNKSRAQRNKVSHSQSSTTKLSSMKKDEECPISIDAPPNTDIQMLNVYEQLKFDNPDGGPWKQGWRIEYDPYQWNSHHKLKVFIIPHSHNDPGWLKTFENYYTTQTKSILNNLLQKLSEDSRRKFVWAEISFFSLWWDELSEEQRNQVKKLIASKQLEIVTGGWVMNDEATSHWISIIQQLTTGHQWLRNNLNIIPRSGWSIDPFGHSATQPYLLKLAGINGSLIQRIHYSVKKEFAKQKYLEFRWRQAWDSKGVTDMWTHMMPFYSYDIPHSCGPDPKICCQFDFKRLPGYGLSCPWKIAPQPINERNVNPKAELLLDQWRKKSQLYKTRVVLMPLGDDFRWDHSTEWDAQFNNYDKLIDYLNHNENLNVEVHYGTLSDYFEAVKKEMSHNSFPTLSGDFFTYADRDDHYWSGYYTSRPFYKRMDRVLMAYVRSAEIILTLSKSRSDIPNNIIDEESDLSFLLEGARKSLALFQHHDGVTGTSRDPVVIDYGKKLLQAIKDCQTVIQKSAYHLLVQPEYYHHAKEQIYFEIDDIRRDHSSIPEKSTITIGVEVPSRKIVIYNSLSFSRNEVVTLLVSTRHINIVDSESNLVDFQISPVILSGGRISDYQYQVNFIAKVPALGLSSYIITAVDRLSSRSLNLSTVSFLNYEGNPIEENVFKVNFLSSKQVDDFVLKHSTGNGVTVAFSKIGLIKAIKLPGKSAIPIHLDFRKYGTRQVGDKSGGYLFLPGIEGSIINETIQPLITIVEGNLVSWMSVQFPFVHYTVTIYSGCDHFIEIKNLVDITSSANIELAMKLSTHIHNGDTFFTDLNGFQMIKRKRFHKIPLQANFYPMPSAAYIEDHNMRLTILTSTSLGVAALSPGQIEIIQDRRLNQDDNRGMAQGVLDNHPTQHIFRILVETKTPNCESENEDSPVGHVSVAAHVSSETLINPLLSLLYNGDGNIDRSEPLWFRGKNLQEFYSPVLKDPGIDIAIISYRDSVISTLPSGKQKEGHGLILHRKHFNVCFNSKHILDAYPISKNGQIKLMEIIPLSEDDEVRNSSLTFLELGALVKPTVSENLCPMEIYPYFIYH